MQGEGEEARETRGIRVRPSILRKARIRAAFANKKMGEWIEEAIEEKAAREGKEETQLK